MLTTKNRVWEIFPLFLALALMATGCTPAGPRALLAGKKLLENGKYADAVEKLTSATSLLGTNAQAWNFLGLAYHNLGQTTNAVQAYQKALTLDHNLVETHYNLGCLFLEQSRLDDAKNELTTYTLRRPNSVAGLLKLGAVQLRVRDVNGAEKSFNEVSRLSPQNPEAFNGLGLLLLQKNHPRDAAQYFQAALKRQPNYAPAVLNLAVVAHQQLNDRQTALQKYREYLVLEPNSPNAASINEIVRQLDRGLNPRSVPPTVSGSPQPAIQTTNVSKLQITNAAMRGVVGKPESKTNVVQHIQTPSTTSKIPVTNIETVKVPEPVIIKPASVTPASPTPSGSVSGKTEARGFFQRINPANWFRSKPKPSPLPARSNLNQTLSTPLVTSPQVVSVAISSPASSAVAHYPYRTSINVEGGNRTDAERVFAQGLQAQQQNRVRDSIIAFRSAAKTDPSFFKAHYNLGWSAQQAGELGQALLAYETALAVEPDSADARYGFALALKQANYFQDSANELEKLLSRHPDEARAHWLLANLCAEQFARPQQALVHYKRVLELDSHHPRATDIRFWIKEHSQ